MIKFHRAYSTESAGRGIEREREGGREGERDERERILKLVKSK
jgi:hypothetical protein